MLELEFVKSSHPEYVRRVVDHYPAQLPDKLARNDRLGRETKVSNYGQALHFLVLYDGNVVGLSSGTCAVYTVKSRDEFFGFPPSGKPGSAQSYARSNYVQAVCNHAQYILDPGHGITNLGTRVLKLWREACIELWPQIYNVHLIGFETFVDPEQVQSANPGAMYRADNWTEVGITKGLTKQHVGKHGMHKSWAEQEVNEDTGTVRRRTSQKLVFCRWASKRPLPPDTYIGVWDINKKHADGTYKYTEEERERRKAIAAKRAQARAELLGKRFGSSV